MTCDMVRNVFCPPPLLHPHLHHLPHSSLMKRELLRSLFLLASKPSFVPTFKDPFTAACYLAVVYTIIQPLVKMSISFRRNFSGFLDGAIHLILMNGMHSIPGRLNLTHIHRHVQTINQLYNVCKIFEYPKLLATYSIFVPLTFQRSAQPLATTNR